MNALNNFYESLTEWLNLNVWLGVDKSFQLGFVAGVACILVLVLIWACIRLRLARRERCKGITITGERGDMFITLNAIREFVKRILSEFGETSLEGIKLRQRGNTLVLVVEVVVRPDVELVPLRDTMQNRIVEEAEKRLGIDRPFQVNVTVKSVEATEKQVGNKHRRQETATGTEATSESSTESDNNF